MIVVHVINYFMPGLGYQEEYLARFHAEAGHDVHVVTSDRAYPPQADYRTMASVFPERRLRSGRESREGFTVHRLPAYAEVNTQLLLKGGARLTVSLRPDLVVMHGLARFETVRLLRRLRKEGGSATLVVDDHSLYSAFAPTRYRRAYYAMLRRYLRRHLAEIDHVVPVTNETARFLREKFEIPDRMLTVIPIGTDTDRFAFTREGRDRFRSQLGVRSDETVILYVGKLTAEKGLADLYDAALPVLARSSGVRLVLVGSGADEADAATIRARADADGIGDRIVVRGHVRHDELPDVYSAGDIAVWPVQETMAALEAASCGRPIVLSASEVARERVAAENGIACGSVAAVTVALESLVEDPALRARMGENGARFMRERFGWREIAQRFLDLAEGSSSCG